MSKDSEEADESKKQLPKKRGRKGAKAKTDDSIETDEITEETNAEKHVEETDKEETESPTTKAKAPARKRGKKEIEEPSEPVEATTDEDKEEKSPNPPKKAKAPAKKRGKKEDKEKEEPIKSADATTDEDKEETSPIPPKKAAKKTPNKKGQKAANGKEKVVDGEEVKNTDESEVTENDDEEEPVSPSPKKKSKGKKADHPRTIDMVIEAIRFLNDSGGSSVQAIKAYILENYDVREDMIKHMMKTALASLLKQNLIARPQGKMEDEKLSKQLLSGRYRIHPQNKGDVGTKFRERPASLRQFKTSATSKGKKKKKRKSY